MIHVRASSRLHFGLLAPAARSGRRFGGVGLMVNEPATEVTVQLADHWSVEGELADRAREILRLLLSRLGSASQQPQRLRIERASLGHAGLGTGSQLALAVARAVCEAAQEPVRDAVHLAGLVSRGSRSAIGIHGFDRGGLLVDGGKCTPEAVAPVVARADFPDDWPVVLLLPDSPAGLHGPEEGQAFERLRPHVPKHTDRLCKLVVLDLLPAVADRDLPRFSESITEFSRLAGDAFRPVQGDDYAGARVAELIHFIQSLGVVGVGQSSWGPVVFALAADEDKAGWLVREVQTRCPIPIRQSWITRACNRGAEVWTS